ncbi:MAG: type IX secretion system sortase PorU [bacterium]|nr:type IX secretion system sortase PorU [bacterium]
MKVSAITRSNLTDTAFIHLEVANASYDYQKNNLPYYLVYKITNYNESAIPSLIIKSTSLVSEPHASAIRKYLKHQLSGKFELLPISSIAKRKNLNQCQLVPFRINNMDEIEELLDYDLTWQIVNNPVSRGPSDFVTSSVLATGTWYKIAVAQQGVYKLTKSYLNSIGVPTKDLDPRNFRIYGNGGKMLPEQNKDVRIDDLQENAIKVVGEDDGVFDSNDYVLFFALGPTEWVKTGSSSGLKYAAVKNLYSDSSYYFINTDLGRGKRINTMSTLSGGSNVTATSYDYYNYHEENTTNFGKSGRDFFGEYFDITTSYRFSWDDGDFVVNDTLISQTNLVAAYKENTTFLVSGNGFNYNVLTGPVSGQLYSDYAAPGSITNSVLNTASNEIALTVSKLTPKSLGWMDKLTVNARRNLNINGKQFLFRDTRTAKPGNICTFSITTPLNTQAILWNVTNPFNPIEQQFNAGSNSMNFAVATDQLLEFCVVPSNDFYVPGFAGKISNQNLHGFEQADYVIVTHPLFVKEAERLARFHQQKENLTYVIATTEQIYNEFSSGRQDICAIRDFIRMLYSRNLDNGKEVKYALLMGDGSYNNKNRSLVNNSNLIPTYQSYNTLSSTNSIATDDFYALMDPNEGYYAEQTGKIDIGIGRFTCRSVSEVKAVIAKIENYYAKDPGFQANATNPENCNNLNESPMGDWRNWLVFLGDDEDAAEHMQQADSLTGVVKSIDPSYNLDKIFLDAYQRFSTPGGGRYPDASTDFQKRIKKGALIFNYTGHGGEVGLTAERMVDIDIINNLDNFNKLPLFITATCEFSRYDDPSRTSAGELCLLNPKGGAVALFTTCRLAYSTFNFSLNIVTLEKLFNKLPDGSRPTLGDAIQMTKSDPRVTIAYITNFHLLGDPAMRLAYPENKIITSKINSVPVTSTSMDTLGALAKITIGGYVADNAGNKLSNFNGIVYPTVFDKEQLVSCLINTDPSAINYYSIRQYPDSSILRPYQFKLQKNILYRGKTLVTNGDFSFSFIVPKDVSFAPGPGKISYYATNGSTDANGYYKKLIVGGASKNVLVDTEGPKVTLFLNDKNFVNGGITNEKPVLYADLTDSSGINTLGTGIGHDISVIMDENTTKPTILNDYYEASLNSYQSGRVRYPYANLSEGEHRLSFKVWDIQNNSNTVYSDFIVAPSAELALQHVLNYPNPFTTRTKFFFEHNQACNPLKVTIQIYTVSGKLVKTIQTDVTCEGYRPAGVDWDGRDDFGDKLARGVYVYKLAILDVENKKAEKIEKLVILN